MLDDIRAQFEARLAGATTEAALKSLNDEFLGRKAGHVTGLMKQLGSLPADSRREFGARVNTLKTDIETALEQKREALVSSRPPSGAVDVTLPGRALPLGRI